MRKSSNIVTLSNKIILVTTITYAHKSILAFLCLLSLAISGCSTYEQDFDCPPGVGMGCVSISEVNSVVDKSQESSQKGQQGAFIKLEEQTNLEETCPICKVQEVEITFPVPLPSNTENTPFTNKGSNLFGKVHRTREKIARVWLSSYEDEEGNFWEEGYVHVLLKPSQWKNEAIQ